MTHTPRIMVELTPGEADALLYSDSATLRDLRRARDKLTRAIAVEAGSCGDIARADAEQRAAIEAEGPARQGLVGKALR